MRRMGVPVVLPSKYPERIFILSASFRGVVILLWPGRRLSSATCISSSVIRIPGGQPSTTTPTAPPWDSPKVVILNNCPKLFPAIFEYYTLGAFLRCGAPASRSPYAIYGSCAAFPAPRTASKPIYFRIFIVYPFFPIVLALPRTSAQATYQR